MACFPCVVFACLRRSFLPRLTFQNFVCSQLGATPKYTFQPSNAITAPSEAARRYRQTHDVYPVIILEREAQVGRWVRGWYFKTIAQVSNLRSVTVRSPHRM